MTKHAVHRRVIRVLGSAALLLFIALFVLVDTQISRFAQSRLFSTIQNKCPACRLEIKTLHVSLFRIPAQLEISDINFQDDPQASTVFDFSADKVVVRFKLISLFEKSIEVTKADFTRAHVTARERDDGPPGEHPDYPPPGAAFLSLFPMRADAIEVHDGTFYYELVVHGQTARIRVNQVDASMGSFVTRENLMMEAYRHPVKIETTALLENSGKVRLSIRFDAFAVENHDEIEIEVKGQKMSELNPFFSIEDHVMLDGTLERAHAVLALSEGRLSGTFSAAYKELNLKYSSDQVPRHERGAISSFFSNVMEALVMSRSRPRENERTPLVPVHARRLKREPVTKLILRGLEASAHEILKGHE